jgi:twinkle protein
MVVTGRAGSGKSSWINQMVAQMALLHHVRVGIASFEMRINPFVTRTLASVHSYAKAPGSANEWIDDAFVFIAPEPSKEDDQFDIEWLIEKAETAVIRYGIRILVIDPWNEIEHAMRKGESLTEYTGRAIRALKRFGREFECLVIVVAHPSKQGSLKEPDQISLYDISDTAHFANKADLGVVVARSALGSTATIMIKKIRYQPETGTIGECNLQFIDRRFSEDHG